MGDGDGPGIEPHVVKLREDASGWGKANGPTLSPEKPFLTGLSEEDAAAWVQRNWALEHSTPEDAAAFRDGVGETEDTDDTDDESEGDDLTKLDGVGPARADDLREAGYASFDDIREASVEGLAAIDGVTEDSAASYHDQLAEDE